jgi:hypothetical protein
MRIRSSTDPKQQPCTGLVDMRSCWGERFRDKELPKIPGIIWQTYSNKEYGFALKYPVGWRIEKSNVPMSGGVVFTFCIEQYKPKECRALSLNIYKGKLKGELIRTDSEWADRIKEYGLVPDANLDSVNVFIRYPEQNSEETLLELWFEENRSIYVFDEARGVSSNENKKIIEYLIKSIRFLK